MRLHSRPTLALVLVSVLFLSACSSQVAINEAGVSGDGTRLGLGLNSCGGTYVVDVKETDEAVTVTVTDQRSPISFGGDDCQDGWTVQLLGPLGDRELIDGSRGLAMEVSYEPWNQLRYTEADYRAALEATLGCILAADPGVEASVVEGPDGPRLEVIAGDVPDGQSRIDPTVECSETHIDPLRH